MEYTSISDLVFVYGSLRLGQGNNALLANCPKLGEDIIMYPGVMINLGYFPAVLKTNEVISQLHGEVYKITPLVGERLDRLEGYPAFYDREIRHTKQHRDVWLYFLADRYGYLSDFEIVTGGDWLAYKRGGNVV